MAQGPIPYGRQEITDDDLKVVAEALRSDFLTQGPRVKEFEDRFAAYVGAPHAVAVCNATAALHLCALVQGVGPGKRVITTPNTFVASANSVLYAGGEVVFADMDPNTYCLDPNRVEDQLKKDSKGIVGIIPVDLAGQPSRMSDFRAIADRFGLWITSDACHAPGATYTAAGEVHRVGSGAHAELSTFSFHPVKHIATGEGGMITTSRADLYERLMSLRTHGITKDRSKMREFDGAWDYEMQTLGYNYRIPDVLCALGTSQLSRAGANLGKRQRIASRYQEGLAGLPIRLPSVEPGTTHAYHLYVIRTADRGRLFDFLKDRGIHPQVHYIPVHEQPYYVERYGKQSFPEAEAYYRECLSLPMYPTLTDSQQDRVIDAVREFFRRG